MDRGQFLCADDVMKIDCDNVVQLFDHIKHYENEYFKWMNFIRYKLCIYK